MIQFSFEKRYRSPIHRFIDDLRSPEKPAGEQDGQGSAENNAAGEKQPERPA